MSVSIGKVIKSNSHIDYVCQVHARGEVSHPPLPEEYGLGTWVSIPAGSTPESAAVGLVYDTQLYNPDYGTFGPRLSSQSQLEVFSPDYLNETATLLGVLVIGQMQDGRQTTSGYCPVTAQVGAPVVVMDSGQVRAFHLSGNELEVGYYALLMSIPEPILPPLLLGVLAGLETLMPEHGRKIHALRTNLSWRTRVDLAR